MPDGFCKDCRYFVGTSGNAGVCNFEVPPMVRRICEALAAEPAVVTDYASLLGYGCEVKRLDSCSCFTPKAGQ